MCGKGLGKAFGFRVQHSGLRPTTEAKCRVSEG